MPYNTQQPEVVDPKENLIKLKKTLLEKITREWKEYVSSFLTSERARAMPIRELLHITSSSSQHQTPKAKASKKKVVSKKTANKNEEAVRRWTRSSIRQSIASQMEVEYNGPARPAGRGESLFSVNRSPVAADRELDDESTILSRRITMKGLNDDIELSCVLPTQNASAAGSKATIAIEALEKEELIKMRDALKKAQEQAETLLAQYGI